MVAKSYQALEIIDEPHTVSGKPAMYVSVRMKNGTIKEVRWYSDKEYLRMYPDAALPKSSSMSTQKQALGFDKGYITIFKGNTYEDKDYFKSNDARYARPWGWYFISTMDLPTDLPDDVTPVQLPWELVGNDDGSLKPENVVTEAVEQLVYETDNSEYQGEVGDKISAHIVITKAIELDGYYGRSTMHVMRDENNNCYVWTTSARSWAEGSEYTISGTIKELKMYKGVKQTVLTRCREIE